MESRYSVSLGRVIQELNLTVLYAPEGYQSIQIRTEDVNRPGLQLAGFFDYFVPQRIQLLGLVETTYLNNLSPEFRMTSFERLFAHEIPALVVAHGL